MDLNDIDNAELKALIDGYKKYLVNGVNYQKNGEGKDILFALPLEVVPIKMTINKTVFDQLNLEAPKTWADVIKCAEAITEGTDALGEAMVKIQAGTSLFTGRGVSTDIIKASIKAYLNAINKWDRARERTSPAKTEL
jgi:ABC-type glycerol-3-phosphate transport system substrate-binding protein